MKRELFHVPFHSLQLELTCWQLESPGSKFSGIICMINRTSSVETVWAQLQSLAHLCVPYFNQSMLMWATTSIEKARWWSPEVEKLVVHDSGTIKGSTKRVWVSIMPANFLVWEIVDSALAAREGYQHPPGVAPPPDFSWMQGKIPTKA